MRLIRCFRRCFRPWSHRPIRKRRRQLPGDLIHAALLALRGYAGDGEESHAAAEIAETAIRGRFDESRNRLGLMTRLVSGMGGGASAALSVTHAGAGLFLTALSLASGQDRDMAVLATNEGQLARLALALRASGLKHGAIEEQFAALHPTAQPRCSRALRSIRASER